MDAHNVVPVWHASEKLEYAARTIRPKINAKLPTFLKPYAVVQSNPPDSLSACPAVDWKAARKLLNIDMSVPEVTWAAPGTKAGMAAWDDFLTSGRFKLFADKRNDPNVHACSGLRYGWQRTSRFSLS